jgi:hypothetical protein
MPKPIKTMKKSTLLLTLVLSASLPLAAPLAYAASGKDHASPAPVASAEKTGKLVPLTEKDAEWAVKARKDYPLTVCLTSDEALGSMGKSPEYIYRVEGKPDQLVIFCCDGCEEDFMKTPATYLAKIEAAKKAKDKTGTKKEESHKGHH